MGFIEKKVSIKDLILWDENARFPDQYYNSDEKELIKYFLNKPGFKIVALIEEIVLDFDLPHLEKIVVWDNIEQFIVLEGNRRLTGYKLLANPSLIEGLDSKTYSYLFEKNLQLGITSDFKMDCLISDDKEECLRYVDRKHNKGNNQVNWLEPERVNYSKRRGNESQNAKLKVAITNYVRQLDLPENLINSVLGKGYVTTFFRLVATGPAKETYGLKINTEGQLEFEDKNFPEKLKVIIYNVLKKEGFDGERVDSRTLNKNPEIKDYLKSVKSENLKKVKKEIKKNTTTDFFGNETLTIGNQKPLKTPPSKPKKIIFGKELSLRPGRVNDLYHAIEKIYKKHESDELVMPIIGMSLRLITEVAARTYFEVNDPDNASEDQLYKKFLKMAYKDMSLSKEKWNYLSLTTDWLNGDVKLEGLLAKYAHGSIITSKDGILKSSFIIGEILEYYFGKS